MFRKIVSGCIFMLAGLTLSASADEYSVQVAALSETNDLFAENARRHGELFMVRSESGVIRYQIGRHSSRADAEWALGQLRDAGFSDAFIVTATPDTLQAEKLEDQEIESAMTSIPATRLPASGISPIASYDELPADLREKAVTLDGVLHIKDGDRFIPLDEYLQLTN